MNGCGRDELDRASLVLFPRYYYLVFGSHGVFLELADIIHHHHLRVRVLGDVLEGQREGEGGKGGRENGKAPLREFGSVRGGKE